MDISIGETQLKIWIPMASTFKKNSSKLLPDLKVIRMLNKKNDAAYLNESVTSEDRPKIISIFFPETNSDHVTPNSS